MEKDTFIINKQNGIKAIMEVNSSWGIDNDFFSAIRSFTGDVIHSRIPYMCLQRVKTFFHCINMEASGR